MIVLPTPNEILARHHYLGPSTRARFTYQDELGVIVFAAPSSRNLPKDWLELARWCILGGHNSGSLQWKRAVEWVRERSFATTVVSYSDPSAGHNGALYRASGWLWAPTWQRLFPPPTGQGEWTRGKPQAVKDRWVALLRPDAARAQVLSVKDGRVRRIPWTEYVEPQWKRGVPQMQTGGGNYRRWIAEAGAGK